MKIAVSSTGQSLHDPFDPRFGRCAGFVVYDTDSRRSSFLDNSEQQNMTQGAGIKAVQMISVAGIDVLISGQLGPKALQALGQAKIQFFTGSAGTVQEAIESWQRNEQPHATSTAADQSGSAPGAGRGGGGRGRGPDQGGQGRGGGARGRGTQQGGQGLGGGGKKKGLGQGGRGKGGGGKGPSR